MRYDQKIKGLTVNLRPIDESDAEITFKMRSDPEKSRYVHGATGTVEDQRDFIRRQIETPGDWLFVVENKQGDPIGMKGVYGLSEDGRRVETGRFMNFGSQVQGTEALCLSFDFAFNVLGVDEVIMSALETNSNMLGMQKRLGAVETHRDHNSDFGCDSVYSTLTKEAYGRCRQRAFDLVQRFAGRKG